MMRARMPGAENDFFDFDKELEHLQILDNELVIELNALVFVTTIK
jgi:hypothetical protein